MQAQAEPASASEAERPSSAVVDEQELDFELHFAEVSLAGALRVEPDALEHFIAAA